jgi:hypothetical protein
VNKIFFLFFISFNVHAFMITQPGMSGNSAEPWWTKLSGQNAVRKDTGSMRVAIDSSGNIYTAGYTDGNLSGNTLIGAEDCYVAKYDSSGTKLWVKTIGDTDAYTECTSVAVDSSGNVYATGNTNGNLNGQTVTGDTDYFFVKYSSAGTLLGGVQSGVAAQNAYGYGIAVDASGNILVGGSTDAGLDGNTLVGNQDYFVVKYNSSFTRQWTKEMGASGKTSNGYDIAVDASASVFITGASNGAVDGNTKTGSNDVVLTKYNTSGVKQWTKQLGVSSKFTEGHGVATDSSGNVIVAGYTGGNLDGQNNAGVNSLFILKYDTSGTKQWTRLLGVASKGTIGHGIAVDGSANIYVLAETNGGVDGNTLAGTQDILVTKYNSAGTKQWTKQSGVASATITAGGVALDSSGNIYLTASSTGGLDGNTITGSDDGLIIKYDSSPTKTFTKQFGALGVGSVEIYGVATDSSGNVYVTGKTDGGLDGNSSIGYNDLFIKKYNSLGVAQWTKQIGGASAGVSPSSIFVDSSANVYVAGQAGDGGVDGNTLVGSEDMIVTKFNTSGVKQWTKELGVSGAFTSGAGVAVDSSGNVFVAGSTQGNLDGNTLTGTMDMFITKYNSAGTKQWTKLLGVSSKRTEGAAIALDSSGNAFVVGITNGNLDSNTLTGTTDTFVVKYNTSGTKQTSFLFGVASAATYGRSVSIDSSGNIYIGGDTSGALDGNTQTGIEDAFVTKMSASGGKFWTKLLGAATHYTYASSLTTDDRGNLYLIGTTNGAVDGRKLTGSQDVYVIKYNVAGKKQWTKQYGSSGNSLSGSGIGADSKGNIFIGGSTVKSIDGQNLIGLESGYVIRYGGN